MVVFHLMPIFCKANVVYTNRKKSISISKHSMFRLCPPVVIEMD